MDFQEWQRLMNRKEQLNKIFSQAPPSAFSDEEWDALYEEFDEISAKLYNRDDQSSQERNMADPLYGKD